MEAIECGVLQAIGGPRDTRASIYLPETGAKVLVLVNSHTRGMIIGYLPESSSESLDDPLRTDDKLREQDLENFRGSIPEEASAGEYQALIGKTKVLATESRLAIGAGSSKVLMQDSYGKSILRTQADSVSHRNSLFSMDVTELGGSTEPSMEMNFFTEGKESTGSLDISTLRNVSPSLVIKSNKATPLEITKPMVGTNAGFSIDANGRVTISGTSITFSSNGKQQVIGDKSSELLQKDLDTEIILKSSNNITVESDAKLNLKATQAYIDTSEGLAITTSNTSITATGTVGVPLLGNDQSLQLSAPSGGISITSGASVPSLGNITKPGVAIESECGGDIHIRSNPSLGSAFTTGAIVLDAATPASISGSGGVGNYGIVLNSPNIALGGYVGVPDTPKGTLSPFPPPVPPIVDGPMKHFTQMTIHYPALLAAGAAGLTAAFPITSLFSVPAFTGVMSTALALMSSPTVGRPTSVNLGGI